MIIVMVLFHRRSFEEMQGVPREKNSQYVEGKAGGGRLGECAT